ncbi:MAG: hypothetical protein M0R06_26205, partial [Sphaerochaeta sp.]|nr:hypothetical protein [Sphaerochaeta sp.]
MAYPAISIAKIEGRIIRVKHPESVDPKTYLTSASVAGAVSLAVADKGGFSSGDFVRMGKIGSDSCEIVAVSSTVARGQNLPVGATLFAHSPGETIEKVNFDQVKIYGNSTNSTSGATLIATVDQAVDDEFTTYINTGTEYAFYFAREHNSATATDSDAYSDGVASTGYSETMVGSIIERALDETGTRECERISYQWTLNQVNDCLKEVR